MIFKKLPNKKYDIIYADPPWEYRDKALAGNRGACCKYKTMSIKEMCSIPVKNILNKHCFLFIWVTMPVLNECFKVINAWGFIYKTCAFTWIKTNSVNDNTLFCGMGNWTRANSELCLLATKGKPKRISASVHSVVIESILKHSQKPDEVRQRIIRLVGKDKSKIELFARRKIVGWDSWGEEL